MHRMSRISTLKRVWLVALPLLAAPPAFGQNAGSVQFAMGDARIRGTDGVTRAAQKGDSVAVGDQMITGSSGMVQLRMVDNAFIAVRPDSEMRIAAYVFSGKPDGPENAVLQLLKGTMRAFTGGIAGLRRDRFQMTTPTATVGIRGSGNVLHFSPALGTINHTIEGAHTVQGLDGQGQPAGPSFVTRPGITVQVIAGRPPERIVTPPVIREAIASPPRGQTVPQQQGQQQSAQAGQQGQSSQSTTQQQPGNPTGGGETAPRANAGVDTALASPSGGTITGATGNPGQTTLLSSTNTITGAGTTGSALNLTTQTQTFSSGQTGSLTSTPAQLAALAASSAASAEAALASLVSANPGIAGQTLPAAQAAVAPAITTAATANNSAQALDVSANLAAANGIAATSATQTATATGQKTQANTAFAANGAFADATVALAANNAVNTAAAALQGNNNTLQTALSNVQAASTSLAQNKIASATAAANMNAAVTGANNSLAGLNTTLAALVTAGAAPGTASSASIQSLLAIAQAAASAAQNAATQAQTFENAGNTAQAQAQLLVAQQQETIAAKAYAGASAIISGIAATQVAQNAATTVATATTAAQSNATAATSNTPAPAATPGSPANLVQTNAATVATNLPLAAYSNPAFVPTSGLFSHIVLAPKAVAGGVESVYATNDSTQAGANYLLNGNKNLVDIRNNANIFANGANYTGSSTSATPSYTRFAGGVALDSFKAPDNSVYLGRWMGGSMDLYSDTGPAGGTSLIESIPLGALSAHYLVNANSAINFARALTGTSSYALVASTQPTDAFGNTGVLGSASLSANFSAQTVDAGINLSFSGARTMTMGAAASNMPMRLDALSGASAPFQASGGSVTCSGVGCGSGYTSSFNGAFGGVNGAGAGLIYQLFPIQTGAPANTPRSDLITGVAAFSSAGPAFAGTAIPVANSGNFRAAALYPVTEPGGATFLAINGQLSSTTATIPAASLLFDAGGRLTRILGEEWGVFNAGSNVNCSPSTPCLGAVAAGSPATQTIFSMASGTVPNLGTSFNANGDFVASNGLESYNSGSGIRFGRYQGGLVNAMEGVGGGDLLTSLGGNSVVWMSREVPSAISLTGSYHYAPKFGTAPADSLGNVGTLYGAALSVNFANQTVDVGMRLGINGYSLRAYAPGVALQSGGYFDASSATGSLRVGCLGGGCPPYPVGTTSIPTLNSGYGGRIQGGLANGGNDAMFRYTFSTFYLPTVAAGVTDGIPTNPPPGTIVNNYITGVVGFGLGAAVVASTPPEVLTTYAWLNGQQVQNSSNQFGHLHGDSISFTGGRFVSAVPGATLPGDDSLTIGGVTANASGPTVVPGGSGISLGNYQGSNYYGAGGQALTVTGQDSGNFANRPVLGGLSWISGPAMWPVFASHILSGTVSYTGFLASAPGDLAANTYAIAGSVTPATATVNAALNVNLSNQSASATVNVTLPPNAAQGGTQNRAWSAAANNIALDDGGGFNASSGGASVLARRSASVTLNGNSAFGNINGQLTGALINGAMLTYSFGGNDGLNGGLFEGVGGVIGFYNPSYNIVQQSASTVPATTIDPLSPFQLILQAHGTIAGLDGSGTPGSVVTSTVSAAAINDEYLTHNVIAGLEPNRVSINNQNQLTRFNGRSAVVIANPCAPSTCSPNVNSIPVTVSIVPSAAGGPATGASVATVLDAGVDAVTGLRWGRYDTGTFALIDRVTGAVLNSAINLGGINHYLIGGTQTGATTLPTTGTASYTLVGNTNPTNGSGVAGSMTSAALSANFAAQTVNASVSATVSGVNWSASASNLPIIAGLGFEATKPLGGTGTLSVSCSGGACNPAATAGRLSGVFFGATGQGAGFAYSLFSGTVTPNVSVSGVNAGGVAAFKR